MYRSEQGDAGMYRTTGRRLGVVAALMAAILGVAVMPAAAHGGSVAPPTDEQQCRDLALYDKGQAGHAEGGSATAGDAGSAVTWGHCP